MIVVLSGEGPRDIGTRLYGKGECRGDTFRAGPMSLIVDQVIESDSRYDYSVIETHSCVFISKQQLEAEAANLKPVTKESLRKAAVTAHEQIPQQSPALPGVKREKRNSLFLQQCTVTCEDRSGNCLEIQ